ncbi:hypothetical protein RDI58_029293 [Solanum bulbocastanum]|uniref:DUF4283 domain-containing protein n=1 Tax=Solanum bulbocastanum TaxID=147425 RepID=A0AAN8XZT2_SOLBU
MARGRKKKDTTKLVVTPARMETPDLRKLQEKELTQGRDSMEHWQSLPTRGATPNRESPTIATIERYIVLQVNTVSKPKVYYHNDGYSLVRFASLDDKNEVLYSGPQMLNNKSIIVKIWSADFNFNKEVLQTVPIWVKYLTCH